MSQSLSRLYIHVVFHIKYSSVTIRPAEEAALYAYMGAVIKDLQSTPIIINGTENHVHILAIMSKNIALAKFVEDVKRHSSRWIKKVDPYYKEFAWQGGYGGFSVSQSVVEPTKRYIENQKEHHRKKTFEQEYLRFLQEYQIDYDENFLWRD